MTSADLVNPIPPVKLFDHPEVVMLPLVVALTAVLVLIAGRLDPTGGALTISVLVTIAFIGIVVLASLFTVPTDEITSAVIGGLVAAFGATVVYWLGRPREPPQ